LYSSYVRHLFTSITLFPRGWPSCRLRPG
jgi:hypothetical protein